MRTDIELPITPELLLEWLSIKRTESKNYHHLLLRQTSPQKWNTVIDEMIPYFENAHLDARTLFHRMAGIDLHPTGNGTPNIQYPNSLPSIAQRGLFGEVLCGLITESYKFVGNQSWNVPIFLFRYHQDAEHYINRLVHGCREREVVGRLGDDFLGLALNDDGTVAAILVGEAKFRKSLPPQKGIELMEEVHKNLSKDADVPVNIMRMSELLRQKDAKAYYNTYTYLEKLNLSNSPIKVPRFDLVCLVVEKTKREYPPTYIPQNSKHLDYTSNRALQAVEVIIEDACELVEEIYQRLYSNGGQK